MLPYHQYIFSLQVFRFCTNFETRCLDENKFLLLEFCMFYTIFFIHDCLLQTKIFWFTLEHIFYLYLGRCCIFLTLSVLPDDGYVCQPKHAEITLIVLYPYIPVHFFFPMAQQPFGGLGRLIFRGFTITDTPHLVGLLWTSDQLVAETSTWQHTTLTRDRHPCPRRDSNPQSQ